MFNDFTFECEIDAITFGVAVLEQYVLLNVALYPEDAGYLVTVSAGSEDGMQTGAEEREIIAFRQRNSLPLY